MAPGEHDFTIYAGASFAEIVGWQDDDGHPVDLNGYTARMQVRSFSGLLVAELNSEDGTIAAQPDGRMRLYLDAALTRAIPVEKYRYDLLVRAKDNGAVTPLLTGAVGVRALVTADAPAAA